MMKRRKSRYYGHKMRKKMMAIVLIEGRVEGDRGRGKRETKKAVGRQSELMKQRTDNGESEKSKREQTVVASAGARMGAPTALTAMVL
eukprot:gene19291-21216_t